MSRPTRLAWREILWQRPVDPARALEFIRRLAADPASPLTAIELRSQGGTLKYLIATPPPALPTLRAQIAGLVPGSRLVELDETARRRVQVGRQLKASTHHRALRPDAVAAARMLLTALTATRKDERLVVQLLLGPRRIPLAIPTKSPSSTVAPWWFVLIHGTGGQIDSEKRTALRDKVSDHGFASALRVGASAPVPQRRADLVHAVLSALKTNESTGLQLRTVGVRPGDINSARRPRWLWPLRLNSLEVLALTGWPVGDDELPGLPSLHPRPLPPAPGTVAHTPSKRVRVIAAVAAPGVRGLLSQSPEDALRHTHVMAPTGAGKSVLLGRLIEQDVTAGRSVVVVEPRGDLVEDVLGHLPANRIDDVVVLDPAVDTPVGLNPLVAPGRSPEVIADGLLTVFRAIYADAWGPRLQDILHASLLTLARRQDTSLLMLPLLLTNVGFRRSLTKDLRDPIALGPFWTWYEGLSEGERAAAIAPLMNKIRPWLFSPRLRAVLGQRAPRFDLRELLTERRILLVPLRGGVIGSEVSRLLGSLVVAQLWQLIQSRAAVAPAMRHPVMIYIDEVQDYLHLPTDLGDALAQARGLGAALTLSHQHLAQLPSDVRTGVLSNARSRLLFQLGQDDANVMARGHPEVEPQDFTSLGAYELYASLYTNGRVMPYAAGRSLAPTPWTSSPDRVRTQSLARYGRALDEVDAGFSALVGEGDITPAWSRQGDDPATGRRRRSSHD